MKYLICYYFSTNNGGFGFANITVTTEKNEDIYTEKEINNIQKQLKEAYGFSTVAIQNIIKLND